MRFLDHCHLQIVIIVVYYESIKQESMRRPIFESRCDERLKTKVEEFTRLVYTGLLGELEHLKIKTRLIDEKFASVMGECDLDVMYTPSKLIVIHKDVSTKRKSKIKTYFRMSVR
jgi:hypothetical protein